MIGGLSIGDGIKSSPLEVPEVQQVFLYIGMGGYEALLSPCSVPMVYGSLSTTLIFSWISTHLQCIQSCFTFFSGKELSSCADAFLVKV